MFEVDKKKTILSINLPFKNQEITRVSNTDH